MYQQNSVPVLPNSYGHLWCLTKSVNGAYDFSPISTPPHRTHGMLPTAQGDKEAYGSAQRELKRAIKDRSSSLGATLKTNP